VIRSRNLSVAALAALLLSGSAYAALRTKTNLPTLPIELSPTATHLSLAHDTSVALASMTVDPRDRTEPVADLDPDQYAEALAPRSEAELAFQQRQQQPVEPIRIVSPAGAAKVEQARAGTKPAARMVANFEGEGSGFSGPQGPGRGGLDYSLAVGPNHVVAIVNGGGIAIWTKKGRPDPKTGKPMFDTTGKVIYGPVSVRQIWRGFGGQCDTRSSGDAVVRYDQLADRWLFVAPIFSRYEKIANQEPYPEIGVPHENWPGQKGQPGAAVKLEAPDSATLAAAAAAAAARGGGRGRAGDTSGRGGRGRGAGDTGRARVPPPRPQLPPNGAPPPNDTTVGTYGMCYAVSTSSDPLGSYYRYEFIRPYFPDYPRPAIWPDGYYIPTSTSDNFIQKHACVADRAKMLKGENAAEQCIIVNGIPFLNMADMDGKTLPPPGAPIPVLAAGGSQLRGVLEDSVIYSWQFHVDWKDPSQTKLIGPVLIPVAPYHFLCDGQLKQCVPQPENNTRLDSQGDKLMARLTYRRIGNVEHVLAAHSVNTSLNGGGVRWYEFRVNKDRSLSLYQQGTYAPGTAADSLYRWLPSAAMDKFGNIGIGYSFGGLPHHAEIRFTGRQPNDPKGQMTFAEATVIEGGGSQTASRFEDYTQTAVDPDDDCTIWHVGAYVRAGTTTQASRISAFKMPGCR
jgi:hypothetical protein